MIDKIDIIFFKMLFKITYLLKKPHALIGILLSHKKIKFFKRNKRLPNPNNLWFLVIAKSFKFCGK